MSIEKNVVNRTNFLSVDRNLIRILGNDKAILLAELARKERILIDRKRIEEDGFFYYENTELIANIGTKQSTLIANIKFFKNCKIISVRQQKQTSLNLFKLNNELILYLMQVYIPPEIRQKGVSEIWEWTCLETLKKKGVFISDKKLDEFEIQTVKNKPSKADKQEERMHNLEAYKKLKKDKYYPLLLTILKKSDKYFRHTLPTEKNNYKITKTIKESLRILKDLANNSFLDGIDISKYPKDFLNLGVIDHPLFLRELEGIIKLALDRWELMFQKNYFPYDKNWMYKISLPNWFYNKQTNKSNFLILLNAPLPIKEKVELNLKNQIDEDILAGYLSLFEEIDENKLPVLYQNIKEIINFGKEYTERYGEWLKYTNYYKHSFGSEFLICKKHIEYLKIYQDIQVGHIKFEGKVWNNFEKKVYSDFKIDLNPTKKTQQNWEKRYYLNSSNEISDKMKEYYLRKEEPPKEMVENRQKYMELFNNC